MWEEAEVLPVMLLGRDGAWEWVSREWFAEQFGDVMLKEARRDAKELFIFSIITACKLTMVCVSHYVGSQLCGVSLACTTHQHPVRNTGNAGIPYVMCH